MEVRCDGCGSLIEDPGAVFCGACGKQLPAEGEGAGSKFCDSCGTENPAEAIFCLECGDRFEDDGKSGAVGIGLAAGAGGVGGAIGTAAATAGGGAGAVAGAAGAAGSITGAGMSAGAVTGAAAAGHSLTGAAGAAQALTGAAGAGHAVTGAAGAAQAVTGAGGAGQAIAGAAGAGSAVPPPPPPPPTPPPPPPAATAATSAPPAQPSPPQPSSATSTQPPPTTQAPPQPPPQPAQPLTPQPQPQVPGGPSGLSGVSAGGRVGTIITRGLTVIGIGSGVVLIGVMAASALMFTGNPAPCVNRTSTPSSAAAESLQSKWDAFKAANGGTNVQFSELEVTSRAVAYLQQRDVPVSNLQVYFCPDGKAQAKGQVSVLGRTANVLLTGHLDVSGGQNVVVIDSVQAGNLPSFLGTTVVNQVIDRNNVRNLPLGLTLTSATNADGSTRLAR